MLETRTVLLIGRTGQGKSTLGNVLVGKTPDANGQGLFKESDALVSETTDHAIANVVVNNINYRIVDTIGIGDNRMDPKDVLLRLARACAAVKDGIHQILFVNGGRFSDAEIEAWDLIRTVVLRPEVANFTTIVQTKFAKFRNAEQCLQAEAKMKDPSSAVKPEVLDIYRSVAKVVFVNNPNPNDDIPNWEELRSDSRTRILARLELCDKVFLPDDLKDINQRVGDFVDRDKKAAEQMAALQSQIAASRQQLKQLEDQRARDGEAFSEANRQLMAQLKNMQDAHQQQMARAEEERQRMQQQIVEAMKQRVQERPPPPRRGGFCTIA